MTYSELVTLLEQYLENEETTFIANIPVFVRLCEEDVYRNVQLPDLRQNSTNSVIIGDPYLRTPADYLSSYSMAVKVSGSFRYLLSKEVNFIREAYPDPTVTDVPRYFAQFDEDYFILAPTPDAEYEVELNYFYIPETLSTAGTNWLSENGENALLFGTLYHGYIYMKGDQDVANMYKEKYDKAVDDLKTIAEGRIRKDSYRMQDRKLPV